MVLQMKSGAKQPHNNGYPFQTLSKETLKQLLARLVYILHVFPYGSGTASRYRKSHWLHTGTLKRPL